MDSEWALLEFRPGRYVKVTANGEVIGRPTDEEIRTWFASRGWGVDSAPGSLSLHLDRPGEAWDEEPETVVLQQRIETPGVVRVETRAEAVEDGPPSLSASLPPPDLDSSRQVGEEVPVMTMPEPEVSSKATPIEPLGKAQARDADADKTVATRVQADELAPGESLDIERANPEQMAQEITSGLGSEMPSAELKPPSPESATTLDVAGEVALEAIYGPPATSPPFTRSDGVSIPDPRELQEAGPVAPGVQTTPVEVDTSTADGTGRWLWVDPRQEGGYGRGGYDSAAFLARAVELFASKPWAGGRNPSRLAVHPDHITADLESAAEALGLEVLGDARVMAGTYMLGLGDRPSND